jgi:hypothetical protein
VFVLSALSTPNPASFALAVSAATAAHIDEAEKLGHADYLRLKIAGDFQKVIRVVRFRLCRRVSCMVNYEGRARDGKLKGGNPLIKPKPVRRPKLRL